MSFSLSNTIPAGMVYLQPSGNSSTDLTGLCTASESYIGNYTDLVAGLNLYLSTNPAIRFSNVLRSPHPQFPSLGLYRSSVQRKKAGLGLWQAEYRGLSPSLSSPPGPVYSCDITTSNDPIDTNPNFVTKIAGKPSAPLNGAIFLDPTTGLISSDDSLAQFAGFVAGSPYAGVSDYLTPGVTFKVSYVSYGVPTDGGEVGTVSPPDGPAPTFGGGYNWLYIGLSYTDNAGLYRVEKSWRLSGPSGWSRDIYS